MPDNVLGPEWGSLAGLPAEQALEYMAKYAADLEQKAEKAKSGGERLEEGDDTSKAKPPVIDSLQIARNFNSQSKTPLGVEFVGRRESARREARAQVEALGYRWDEVEATVEKAMSGTTADHQTDARAWVAAFVYAYGQADVAKRMKGLQSEEGDTPAPPRPGFDEEVVVSRGMTADRGNPSAMYNSRGQAKIEDPVERNTKRQFEKVLGYRIPDDEWLALQDPDMIKTYEDWEEYKATQEAKGGR